MALMYFYKSDFAMTGKKMNVRISNRFHLCLFYFFPEKRKRILVYNLFLKCKTLVVRIFEIKINPNLQPIVYLQTFIHMLYWKIEPGLKSMQGRYDDVV
jgi:hypothetical protein